MAHQNSDTDPSVARRVWFFTKGMGLVLLGAGLAKVVGISQTYEFFEELGLPRSLVPASGLLEILVGLLCLNRSTRSYGALGVFALMGTASLSHVMSGAHLYMLFINAYFFVAAIWVLRMERPRFLRVDISPDESLPRPR